MSRQHHSVNYIELPLVDHASTKSFYQSIFGWEFQDWGPDYLCFTGAGIDLGFSRELSPSGLGKGVLVILYSKDLEKTEVAVRQTDQQVVRETFDFPGGRRFHFADPNGNEIAVWSESAAN